MVCDTWSEGTSEDCGPKAELLIRNGVGAQKIHLYFWEATHPNSRPSTVSLRSFTVHKEAWILQKDEKMKSRKDVLVSFGGKIYHKPPIVKAVWQ